MNNYINKNQILTNLYTKNYYSIYRYRITSDSNDQTKVEWTPLKNFEVPKRFI